MRVVLGGHQYNIYPATYFAKEMLRNFLFKKAIKHLLHTVFADLQKKSYVIIILFPCNFTITFRVQISFLKPIYSILYPFVVLKFIMMLFKLQIDTILLIYACCSHFSFRPYLLRIDVSIRRNWQTYLELEYSKCSWVFVWVTLL